MLTFFAAGRPISAPRPSVGTAGAPIVSREIGRRSRPSPLVRLRYVVNLCCADRATRPAAAAPTHTHRMSEHLTEPMFADDANEQLAEMLLNPDIVAGDLI
jgi:hypothetical protein